MTYAEPVTERIIVFAEAPKDEEPEPEAPAHPGKVCLCKICDSPIPPERQRLEGAESKYCSDDCRDIAWHKTPCRSDWAKRRLKIIRERGYHLEVRTRITTAGPIHGSKI